MSEEAKYEQWLDAAIACEANSMSAEEEHAFALEASLKQEEYEAFEEYEEWLDSKIGLACEANSMSADKEHAIALDLSKIAAQAEEEWEECLESTASVFELPEEIPDICDKWWPKLPVSRAHGRILRLHGLQGYERVRQKLWKGARTMRSRFKRSSAPKNTLASSTSVAYFAINTQA